MNCSYRHGWLDRNRRENAPSGNDTPLALCGGISGGVPGTKPNGVSVEQRSLCMQLHRFSNIATIDAIPTLFFSYALISKPKY